MSVLAVRTTGIFCRDGCVAPSPRPENTERFASAGDALFAGYRPCLRCRPELDDSPRTQRGVRRRALLGHLRRPRRARPTSDVLRMALLRTPIGPMVAAVGTDGLALLEFTDRPMLETQLKIVERRFHARLEPGRTALHDRTQRQLDAYFAGAVSRIDVPTVSPGTPFQERCWDALTTIPAGTTTSYLGIAAQVGRPSASRAVGHANGMNRLALVIPCHRVIAADGGLGGYGGGVWRKAWLIDHERRMALRATRDAVVLA
jgi:AraC family transcriptional regulator, regulatory protein of adaptative response / methylated-DNA-[protein]-cysteine methyltransferase